MPMACYTGSLPWQPLVRALVKASPGRLSKGAIVRETGVQTYLEVLKLVCARHPSRKEVISFAGEMGRGYGIE